VSILSQYAYVSTRIGTIDLSLYKVIRNSVDVFFLPSPTPTTDIATGFEVVTWDDSDDIAVGVVYTYGGITYGVKDVTNIKSIRAFPGLRQAVTEEVIGANSQVKLAYWFVGANEELNVHVEVDGGGVVLQGLRVVRNLLEYVEI
jgi:hypothetical protein